ncbi:hypothetical protein [Streptomyces anulatus]|uniref:hypothetical protein n=1 Tax=Streptomyces anulatus TaxID=1892 RepID=UPI0037DD0F34|nr:hypothetical protein OHB50_39045 [Streptomyces anulatus]
MSRRPTSPTGVRINRRPYVHVDSATARDKRISYRALGLLTYLLDQSPDWQVRSEQLSQGEGREGRDAIRKAQHELAANGYYRLERRRFLNGKWAMGTAISEYPIQQWADDYVTFGKDLTIPIVQQQDGSFLVKYQDGSLGTDGFMHTLNDEPPVDDEDVPEPPDETGAPDAEEKTAVDLKTERAAAARKAAAEKKAKPAACAKPNTDAPAVPEQPAEKPAVAKPPAAPPSGKAAAKKAAAEEKAAEKKALDEAAETVAKWWWADAEEHLGKYVGRKGGYVAVRNQIKAALAVGYTQRHCADALRHARKHWPHAQQWQDALGFATKGITPRAPHGRVPYSDEATWGTGQTVPGEQKSSTPEDTADDATFGIIA